MRNNGYSQLDERTAWLDTALDGQPSETKARVLELILKYGIDPDNEFFMIFTALGQLQVLIEESPDEWQDLFISFKDELTQWTQTHLKTLEALASKADTTETLAQTSKELGTILTTLVNSCNLLMQRLTSSDQSLTSSIKAVERSSKDASSSLDELKSLVRKQQGHLDSTLLRMNSRLDEISSTQGGWGSKVPWFITAIAVAATGIFGWQQLQLKQTIATIEKRSDWQLQNLMLIACTSGAKPANAPECQ